MVVYFLPLPLNKALGVNKGCVFFMVLPLSICLFPAVKLCCCFGLLDKAVYTVRRQSIDVTGNWLPQCICGVAVLVDSRRLILRKQTAISTHDG